MADRLTAALDRFVLRDGLNGQTVVAALSGGADSVCLLLLLAEASERHSLRVVPVHVHHGIRGAEADGDAAFCEALCKKLGLACRVVREDVPALAAGRKKGLEETARAVRYEALRQAAHEEGASWILTAHHRDDQAETILFHVLRGTGLSGLAGMPEAEEGIGRPLLAVSREEIRAWLVERGQDWREDATNADLSNDRSRIRCELLPLMEKLRPGAAEHLCALGQEAGEAAEYLGQQARKVLEEEGVSKDNPVFPGQRLGELPPALASAVIRESLKTALGSLTDVSRAHTEAVKALASGPSGRRTELPAGVTVVHDFDRLRIGPAKLSAPAPLPVIRFTVIPAEKAGEIAENDCLKWFAYDKIKELPTVRRRHPGDRIAVYADGRHRSLQDLFIDLKIPADERAGVPLVAAGSEVLWVPGYRRSAAFAVTEQTTLVLKAEWVR